MRWDYAPLDINSVFLNLGDIIILLLLLLLLLLLFCRTCFSKTILISDMTDLIKDIYCAQIRDFSTKQRLAVIFASFERLNKKNDFEKKNLIFFNILCLL